jgi:hypothetical protein
MSSTAKAPPGTFIEDVLRAPWLPRLHVLEIVGLIDLERTFLEEHREAWTQLEELRLGQLKFGVHTHLESLPNVRVLHPIEGAEELEPLDWVACAPAAAPETC